MVRLSIPMFVWLWALAGLLALGLLALFYAVREARRTRNREKVRLFCCGSCGRVYVDGRDVQVSVCPGCGAANEGVRRM